MKKIKEFATLLKKTKQSCILVYERGPAMIFGFPTLKNREQYAGAIQTLDWVIKELEGRLKEV